MKIGEIAAASSTPIETIRFYERERLLPPAARTSGNFRVYEQPHLERLQFIRYCRTLDMSLDEVRVLLKVSDDPGADCGDVNTVLDGHIGHVAQRIQELGLLQKQLKELRRRCATASVSNRCGILAGLHEAAQESPPTPRKPGHLRPTHGRKASPL